MADTNDKTGAVEIHGMITAYQKSQILLTACELGVFEALVGDGHVKKTAEQLATELSTVVDATERLLNGCVSLKLLDKSWDSDEEAFFSNTQAASKYLIEGSKTSLKGVILYNARTAYGMMANLVHAVREGKEQHYRMSGVTGSQLYDNFFSNEASTIEFLGVMHGLSIMTGGVTAKAFDLSAFKTVCEFGGGSGALAYEMSRTYPEMSIKVLELPPVVKASKHFEPDDVRQLNVEFVAGDFFVDELPKADLYIFSRIFHNWKEDKINQLLQKAHSALTPGGAVLIAEILYSDDKTGSSYVVPQVLVHVTRCRRQGTVGKRVQPPVREEWFLRRKGQGHRRIIWRSFGKTVLTRTCRCLRLDYHSESTESS
ncbi:acetylserotonin O-methyltransferase-like [Ptychodera flava]|uniref:acetylserotonin O-methyltransferase-like n=1 Tax=Ptychodera flava TaxID=63121 RepID=UPI003969CD15